MALHFFRRGAVCRLLSLLLFFTLLFPRTVFAAPAWPSEVTIAADGGILIDADSGCVIYGKNIHQRYYPASITKILTALIVIERCNLDDTLTFSHTAVHQVESGSTSAGYDTGDQITVRQALYAMLLKSANEVANALAEHCAGSIEAFAELMNEKAASLGCQNSHFVNPSGLNDENHYTTAYDFSLISKAAFENPSFVEFDSTTYYELPRNAANPDPFTVYCGHKMLKKSSGQYYAGIIGGKTGYTMLAGNTLVTCAERDGLRLISVVLNGHQTHYDDTRTLLDFGFSAFKNEQLQSLDNPYVSPEESFNLTGRNSILTLSAGRSVTLPRDARLSDAETELLYEMPAAAPAGAIATLRYLYDGHEIGSAWLTASPKTTPEAPERASSQNSDTRRNFHGLFSTPREEAPLRGLPRSVLFAAMAVLTLLLLTGILFLIHHFRALRREEMQQFSANVRHLRQKDSLLNQEEFFKDSSASVDYYRPPEYQPRSRRKTLRSRWLRRKG